MDWTAQHPSFSDLRSMSSDLPPQTVSLKDLDLSRWGPADNYGTPATDDTRDEHLETSLEGLSMVSPETYSGEIDFGSSSSEGGDGSSPDFDEPLEYAHFHGLCRDYPMDNPLSSDLIPLPPEDAYRDTEEPPGVLGLDALHAEVRESLNERLDVDKETAAFLVFLLGAGKRFERDPIPIDLERTGLSWLKQELPVLAGDHDMQMIALRRRNEVKLSSVGFEPFQLDVEKDEGMAFPQVEIEKKRLLDRELGNERLDISKDTVELLRDVRDLASGAEVDYADESYALYKKGKAIRMSPPLLPVTPPYSPGDPAPEAMQIDMASTPEDLLAKDAAAIEKELLRNDQVMDVTPTEKPLFNPQEISAAIDSYTAVPSSSSPLARKRLRNLRVEPPLTPHYPDESTASDEGSSAKRAKKVHFDSNIVALLPRLQMESSDMLPEIAEQQANELQDTIVREAGAVQQQLQDEQLVDIDTILRFRAPQLESVQAQAPWEIYRGTNDNETSLQSQQTLLQHFSKEFLEDTRKWSGVTKIERTLPWAPFASYLGKVDLNEQFDDGSLERYFADMHFEDGTGDVDVEALIARNGNSQLLQGHDSDDEDIEPVVMEEDDSIDATPEVEQEAHEKLFNVPLSGKPDLQDSLRQKQPNFTTTNDLRPFMVPSKTTAAASLTSAATANLIQSDGIAHFMQLRGKPQGMPRGPDPWKTELDKSSAQLTVQTLAPPAAVMVPHMDMPSPQAGAPAHILVPKVREDTTKTLPVIVSSAFMTNRQLIRRVQTTLPAIEFCERDAAIAQPLKPGVDSQKEADVTISPSTGVIVTTLQKLKQRPLPGQTSFFGIRDRIASTAARYERLIVLVSEGSITTTEEDTVVRPLDQLDCEALLKLTGWAHLLGSEVQVPYIAGGEQEVASWLAAAISHKGVTDGSVKLLHDETMWERWLRTAGLNAFAAQAVLQLLKLPEKFSHDDATITPVNASLSTEGRFGLAAFVSMSAVERVERFGPVLGGERVINMVSQAVDGSWNAQHSKSNI